jgi:hypothetical protein
MLQYLQNKLDELRLLQRGGAWCVFFQSSLPLPPAIWRKVTHYHNYRADVLYIPAGVSVDPAPDGLSCIRWSGEEETIVAFKEWGNLAAGIFAEQGQRTDECGYRGAVRLLLSDLPQKLILDDNPACGVRGHLPELQPAPEVWSVEGRDLFDLASRFIKRIQRQPDEEVTAESKSTSTAPVVTSITVLDGYECVQLEAEGGKRLPIDGADLPIFLPFLVRILNDAPGEVVPWLDLRKANAEDVKKLSKEERKIAGSKLRSVLRRFRTKLLNGLGKPPDGERWTDDDRGEGCRLNTSCTWKAEEAVRRKYGRLSQSVDGRLTDPHLQAENTPDQRQPP